MTSPTVSDLAETLQRHKLSVAPEFHEILCHYCALLWDWNTRINLTRHTDLETFVTRDITDSLQLSKHLESGQTVLDVGSGGGVPGILLAILRPDLKISLAESVQKKARVLDTLVQELELSVPVHAKRGEVVLKTQSFDVLTFRAVAALRKLLFWVQRSSQSFDRMLLIKGPRWVSEAEEAEEEGLLENVTLETIGTYTTPGHDSESVILSIRYQ